jgi:hypothetical protein
MTLRSRKEAIGAQSVGAPWLPMSAQVGSLLCGSNTSSDLPRRHESFLADIAGTVLLALVGVEVVVRGVVP